uniref:cell growth regulator with EF hand domain protein 1 isoform X2 n=1 Tax=Monopterus albus TaxID=43700 RepID=UPI0009B4E0D7|nr:cell growth regulator with EF hand domain protein 1 isoform X2 [Monopterus albus]
MQRGVFMESHLGKLVPCVLFLLLLIHLCLAAPGGTFREDSGDAHPSSVALRNPFGSGEEDRRLLQSYIQSSLKDGQGGPEIITREQEVFFLFHLYDYDRSGLLDGLEMMKLLSDCNSHHAPGAQASDVVVSVINFVDMVDFLLRTQDLNQDGLLAPSELLSPSLPRTQDSSNNNAPQQQEVAAKEKPSNPSTDEHEAGVVEQTEAHKEIQPQEEAQALHDMAASPRPLKD